MIRSGETKLAFTSAANPAQAGQMFTAADANTNIAHINHDTLIGVNGKCCLREIANNESPIFLLMFSCPMRYCDQNEEAQRNSNDSRLAERYW